jgi:uroporphyrinogen-III synthase
MRSEAQTRRSVSLTGKRVLVLRPEGSPEMTEALRSLGAEVVAVAAVVIETGDTVAIDDALGRLGSFDWIFFTSVNGVAAFFERLPSSGNAIPSPPRIGAVGPATRDALVSRGAEVVWMPSRFTTVALGSEFPGPPSNICVVRAANAGPELEEVLRAGGHAVERVDAYRTVAASAEEIRDAVSQDLDAIAFTSASIVDSFVVAVGPEGIRRVGAAVCCIGPATAAACRRAGLVVHVEAEVHTGDGLVEAIAEYLGERHPVGEPK